MTNYPLSKIKKNEILKNFLSKPSFLSLKDEQKLLKLLKGNKLEEFYGEASRIIKNTREIINLYIYLTSKLESQGYPNKEIKNYICWKLFNITGINGWLNLKDPEIIKYCKENTTDKFLLKEIKNVKFVEWFNEYSPYINLERKIYEGFEGIEKNVSTYFDYIIKLIKKGRIDGENYENIIKILQKETTIYKGEQIIGSLISIKLQKKIGFNIISPPLKINKKNSSLNLE